MFRCDVELYARLILRSLHLPGSARSKSTSPEDNIEHCYRALNIPSNATQDVVRNAFLELAKKHHPDSGHTEANVERFCEIENAFRVLTKKNTGSTEEFDTMEYDIRHTAPQHRQYLSYDGVGHGTPAQRGKQYVQVKAQRAVQNVYEHRIAKSMASDDTLMNKEDEEKHAINTQVAFDRLAEDLIQEAMAKGEFDNLRGKGKPLKGQTYNPFVDFTTHKINEVLINNGFTPEWITLNKDIREEIALMKKQLEKERATLGPLPLSEKEQIMWKIMCQNMEKQAKKINSKILSFNLIVPLADKQIFLLKFEEIAEEILKNGKFVPKSETKEKVKEQKYLKESDEVIEFLKDAIYLVSLVYTSLKKLLYK